MENSFVFWLILLPFVGAIFTYLVGSVNRKFAFWGAEIFGLILFIGTLKLFIDYSEPINIDLNWFMVGNINIPIGIYIDQISLVMLLIATGLGFLDIHFSHDYMKDEPEQARYHSKVLFFIGGMILLVIAKDLIGMFIGWELMGLASYLLISFWHFKKDPADAGVSAFLYTRFGDVFLFASIGLLFYFTGTFNLIEINLFAETLIDKDVAFIIAIFIFIGAIGKSGQFPLFPWLMRAMEGPTTVSALIHGATMVNSGIYIVARLFDFYDYSGALIVVASIGGISAFIGATSAIVQKEIKKVLAYSTMSHLSLAFIGLGVGSMAIGMTHLVNHAIFKALLFLSAGAVIFATHHTKDLWKLGGLKSKMPIIAFLMGIGALSLSGIPPFGGFFSKDLIIASAIEHGDTLISFFTIVAGLLSIIYIGRVWILIFSNEPRDKVIFEKSFKPSIFWIGFPLFVMAILTIILGFYGENLAIFISGIEHFDEVHVDYLMQSLIVSLLILAFIVYKFYYKNLSVLEKLSAQPFVKTIHKILFNGYYIEFFITYFGQNIVVNGISKSFHWFDSKVIDSFINGTVLFSRMIFNTLSGTKKEVSEYVILMMFAMFSILAILIFYFMQ